MPDAPTPLDLDAILDDLCRLDDEFGLEPADVRYVREQARKIRDEVERLRTMFGDCHCDKNPETTNGPEEDCPQHGRPVAEVWGLVKRAEDGWDHARAEVDRLRAEVRLATTSAHSASLALGAQLADRAAPAWDEEAVLVALVDAHLASVRQVMEDGYPSIFVRSNEDAADAALAVVRDYLPVKPGREAVARALAEHRLMGGRCRCGLDPRLDYYRYEQHVTDAVLDLLPGRSEEDR